MNVIALKEKILAVSFKAPSQESAPHASTPSEDKFKKILPFLDDIWLAASSVFRGIFLAIRIPLRTCWRYVIHHPLHAILNAILLGIIAVAVITGSDIHHQMILGKISDHTIDKILDASSFQREYSIEEMRKNGARAFVGVGAPPWAQREAIRAILFNARKAGLSIEDQAVLLAIADIESGFNPLAQAQTTTACGLFQFVQKTGETFSLSAAECMDPWKNARAEVEHYTSNYEHRVKAQTESLTGSEKVLRTFELSYYLHHDGPYSENPSNELKALVLSGSYFLFKAYHVLQEESVSEQHAPTFAEKFSENLLKFFDSVAGMVRHTDTPLRVRIGRVFGYSDEEAKA